MLFFRTWSNMYCTHMVPLLWQLVRRIHQTRCPQYATVQSMLHAALPQCCLMQLCSTLINCAALHADSRHGIQAACVDVYVHPLAHHNTQPM